MPSNPQVRRLCWLRPTSPLNVLLQKWHVIFAVVVFSVTGCATIFSEEYMFAVPSRRMRRHFGTMLLLYFSVRADKMLNFNSPDLSFMLVSFTVS